MPLFLRNSKSRCGQNESDGSRGWRKAACRNRHALSVGLQVPSSRPENPALLLLHLQTLLNRKHFGPRK